MYPKGQSSQYKEEFFDFLKMKMKRKLSAEKNRINWLKYPTGIDKIFFRCEMEQSGARFCIDIQHKDAGLRELVYDQFLEMRPVLEQHIGEMEWQKDYLTPDGNCISRISICCEGTNLFEKESWPAAFSFFEKKLVRMDKTWSMAKYTFLKLLQ